MREEWVAIAILRLVESEKAVVEGAGATALAAVLAGELPELKGKRFVLGIYFEGVEVKLCVECSFKGVCYSLCGGSSI